MNIKSDIVTSDKSIVNPIIVNGEIVGYLPPEIPDDTEEIIERFRQEKIFLKEQSNADKRTREVVEAINGLTSHQRKAIFGNFKTLTVFVRDGRIEYTGDIQDRTYKAHLEQTGNPYKLLIFLISRLGEEIAAEDIIPALNPPRSGAEYSSSEGRVSDTIRIIKRNLLNLHKEDDFFTRHKNKFGINCNVEFKIS